MATKRFELDGEPEAIARAVGGQRGEITPTAQAHRTRSGRTRTWWLSRATAGGGPAAQEATLPAPPPDEASEAPALTLAEFLDGL
jgi:hypothetical protein